MSTRKTTVAPDQHLRSVHMRKLPRLGVVQHEVAPAGG